MCSIAGKPKTAFLEKKITTTTTKQKQTNKQKQV